MTFARLIVAVVVMTAGLPALAEDTKTVPFRAPAPGTTLSFDDGTKLHFGKTKGFVTEAASEHKRYPPAKLQLTHIFFVTLREARGNKLRYDLDLKAAKLWPLTLGAKHAFKSAIYQGGKLTSNHQATLSVADKFGEWKLDGRTIKFVRISVTGGWTTPKGRKGNYTIHYDYAPELGFWVRNVTAFTRENGKTANQVRRLTKIETRKKS